MAIAEWTKGSRYKVDADVAHELMQKIAKKNNGELSPKVLVDTAKAKRNPLHDEFEWDDTIAADEFRVEQARHMIRSVHIIRPEIKTDDPQRAWENVTVEVKTKDVPRRKAYKRVEDIMADPDLRAELIGEAIKDLIRIRNRYRNLQEFAVVFRAIDDAIELLEV